MSISAEAQKESKDLISGLADVMNIIDTIQEQLTDGQYLKICNTLKIIYDEHSNPKDAVIRYIEVHRERVRRNPVVKLHDKRTSMKLRLKQKAQSDAQKLENGWKACKICDSLVMNLSEHHQSVKCSHIKRTKGFSAKTNLTETSQMSVIITKIDNICFKSGLSFKK